MMKKEAPMQSNQKVFQNYRCSNKISSLSIESLLSDLNNTATKMDSDDKNENNNTINVTNINNITNNLNEDFTAENDTFESNSDEDNFFLSHYQNVDAQNRIKMDIKVDKISDDESELEIECNNANKDDMSIKSSHDTLSDSLSQNKMSLTAGQYICHLCNYKCQVDKEFREHLLTHYTYSCNLCDYASRTEGRLKRHIKDFHSTESPENFSGQKVPTNNPKSLKCKHCGIISLTKEEHWTHQRTHLDTAKCLECPQCPFITEYKHHLDYHLRNHEHVKPYKCPKCQYCCVNKSMLNSHKKSHSNVYQFRCADCNYASKYCHSLKQHLSRQKHKPAPVLNEDGSLPSYDNSNEILSMKRGPNNRSINNTNVTNPKLINETSKSSSSSSPNDINNNNNNNTIPNLFIPKYDPSIIQQAMKLYSKFPSISNSTQPNLPIPSNIPNPDTLLSLISNFHYNSLFKMAQTTFPFNLPNNPFPDNKPVFLPSPSLLQKNPYIDNNNNKHINNKNNTCALDLSLKTSPNKDITSIKHKCPFCSAEIVEYKDFESHLYEHAKTSSPNNNNNSHHHTISQFDAFDIFSHLKKL